MKFTSTTTGDLVQVLGAGKHETQQHAGWGEGDWNGDSVFGTGDLVIALDDGGYEMGPREDPVAVPEPAAWLPCLIGSVFLCFKRGGRFGMTQEQLRHLGA